MLRSINYFISFTAVFLFLLGCEETEPTEEEPDAAILMVDSAITALEDELFALSTLEVSQPGDIDFTTSNALFKEALALDAENLDANFGAGLTEILLFSQDAEVQAVFDAWEAFLDTGNAFVADTSLSSPALSLGFLLPGAFRQAPIQTINEKEVAYSYLNLFKLVVSNPPTIGDIQDVIESVFLPDLDYALERFDVVDDSSTYSFTITPKMQGDVQEDPVEFDLTELYVLEAAVNLIRSFFSVAVAYNISPSAYDSAAIVNLLKQDQDGGGFLSLRTTGATQMGNAKQSLLDASEALDNAIDFLKAETDDQADDIITISSDGPTSANLDAVTNDNAKFRDYLVNGDTLTEDWNGDGTATDLTFNFGALFDNPIQDFKLLLPYYSVEVGRDTVYEYGDWQQLEITGISVIVNVPADGYYRYHRNHWWDSWDDYEGENIDTVGVSNDTISFSIPRLNEIVDSLLAEFRAAATLGHWDIGTGWEGWLNAGEHEIWTNVWYGYKPRYPDWSCYTGILSWDATSYADWTFPNPSFNGFLSDFSDDTDDENFKRTFGITEDDFLEMKDKPLIIRFEFFSGGIKKMMPGPLGRTGIIPWASRD